MDRFKEHVDVLAITLNSMIRERLDFPVDADEIVELSQMFENRMRYLNGLWDDTNSDITKEQQKRRIDTLLM